MARLIRRLVPLAAAIAILMLLAYVARYGARDRATPVAVDTSASPGAREASRPTTVRIGWTAWADAEIVTNVARRLLEERLGYRVELTMADIGIQYQAVERGDLDLMLMAWLPTTHASYWEKVQGRVIDLGPLYTRARLGWAVPAYVPEAELGSIEDLRDPEIAQRVGRRVHGIDPGSGLMQASERTIAEYGLGDLELVSSSGAAMTAALGKAVREDEWIVVTAWSPHWMFAEWDLRYLDDPRGTLGGPERVVALARPGFDRDFPPEVVELLSRMFIPLPELEAAMLVASKSSVDQAVEDYLRTHRDRVDYWVTGELGRSLGP